MAAKTPEEKSKAISKAQPSESPYRFLAVQFDVTSPVRYLYLRRGQTDANNPLFPPERTINAVGLPAWLTESLLRVLMMRFGAVERVQFESQGKKVQILGLEKADPLALGLATAAHIVFADAKGLKKALKAATLLTAAASSSPPIVVEELQEKRGDGGGSADLAVMGLEGWLAAYRVARPGIEVLKEEVNQYMAEYDAKEEVARLEREATETEDGWTVVVGKAGRKKTTGGGIAVGAVAPAVAARAAEAQTTKRKHLEDFYRFQQKEKRRSELLDLQQKFEEDKKRIARLKAARRFKPY